MEFFDSLKKRKERAIDASARKIATEEKIAVSPLYWPSDRITLFKCIITSSIPETVIKNQAFL